MDACCFTGHRPGGLPKGGSDGIYLRRLQGVLRVQIAAAACRGCRRFISGMALGVDQMAAELVLDLKREYPDIVLECALPCSEQAQHWTPWEIRRYGKLLEQADRITYVSLRYYEGCYADRNRYMVDHSDLVIAVYNGNRRSGTYQTLHYALEQGRRVVAIDPETLRAQRLDREVLKKP
jgi:uncharacterized phage-like protein YoqJ